MNAPVKIERNTKLNIAQRINAAMAEVDYIQKERKQGMQYTIVSHDAVTAKVRPILQGHGVVYYPRDMAVNQSGNRTEAVFNVRFENIDDRTDFIDVATFGYGVDPQDKGPGKAMSYGVKYALLKVLGLETGDDPDTVQDERADHKFVEAPPAAKLTREQHTAAHKDDPFPLGPCKNITELKASGRDYWKDVMACEDSDTLTCLRATSKELETQLQKAMPSWWKGGADKHGETFEGLGQVIERLERDFADLDSIAGSPAAKNVMAG